MKLGLKQSREGLPGGSWEVSLSFAGDLGKALSPSSSQWGF